MSIRLVFCVSCSEIWDSKNHFHAETNICGRVWLFLDIFQTKYIITFLFSSRIACQYMTDSTFQLLKFLLAHCNFSVTKSSRKKKTKFNYFACRVFLSFTSMPIDLLYAVTLRYSGKKKNETSEGKEETGGRNKISYELIRLIKWLNIEYGQNLEYARQE